MRLIKFLFLLLFFLVSCKKNKINNSTSQNDDSIQLKNGIMVLCEGLFQQNNSSISWIDLSKNTLDNLFFTKKTERLLGDTGNDLQSYGNKIYIVVNVSSTIEVLDRLTGKSIKQISMTTGTNSKQPRAIAFYGSNAFITCFDGYVDVLDTNSLTISKRIKVGSNPEGLTVANSKLYVTNSGGLNPTLDSTVSIVNLMSLEEVGKIVVGKNPGPILTDTQGDVYVVARGNYSSMPTKMVKINSITDKIELIIDEDISGFENMGSNLLLSYKSNGESKNKIGVFDAISENISIAELISGNNFTTLYGVYYSESKKRIYCFDAMNYTANGYLKVFSQNGILETSYHVGLNPSKMIEYD